MCDWYNAFLALVYLQEHPDSVHVLYFDAHPQSSTDDMWRNLFSKLLYVHNLPLRTQYRQVVLTIHNYRSFVASYYNWDTVQLPLAEQFNRFVLARYKLADKQPQRLDCSRLRVTLLLRRDYLSHPRNKDAVVGRKIKNGDELLTAINSYLASAKGFAGLARVAYFENVSFAEQLEVTSMTDVLIGMHGAGLSHTMFMPRHGGLIELRQKHSTGRMFEGIAKCRNMSYVDHLVDPIENEDRTHHTVVPPDVILQLLLTVLSKMGCAA